MGYDTPDFIRNPKVEKDMPPIGYDFYRHPVDRDQAAEVAPQETKAPEPIAEAKDPVATPDESVEKFRCKTCGYVCSTERGMKMHMTKAHK